MPSRTTLYNCIRIVNLLALTALGATTIIVVAKFESVVLLIALAAFAGFTMILQEAAKRLSREERAAKRFLQELNEGNEECQSTA